MKKQTFSTHLNEFRSRIFQTVFWIGLGSVVGYYYRDQIITLLLSPIDQPLFYSNPAGGFELAITLSIYFGILCALPFAFYHLIKFLSPALPDTIKYSIAGSVFSSTLLTVLACLFAYFVMIPSTFKFLSGFSTEQIKPLLSTDSYLSFVGSYIFFTSLIFQMPLVIIIINRFIPLTSRQLFSYQRWVIAISFIVAAIITPSGDPFNQTLMAVPIILLYQISILSVWLINRRKKERL